MSLTYSKVTHDLSLALGAKILLSIAKTIIQERFADNMVEDTLRMQTLCRIATEVIAILKEMGHRSAVFGGLACSLYGTDRQPNVGSPNSIILCNAEKKNISLGH